MDDCEEYKAGFCTKTEFFIEGKTEQCPYQHTTSTNFSTKPLNTYNEIISDIDKKIESNLQFLQYNSTLYNKMETTDKIKELINKCEKTNELKRLIKVLGLCINSLSDDSPSLSVCKICSCYYKFEEDCKHIFHNKYKNLREVRDKLMRENFNVK
ncbi:hypothetical protein TUBRATIS_10510 [Tubulinosema ratisbonensis]|uniref:Uncharacterized protein n=1 Tax=Tubulinosema ratisbonensis TaxID=291195 RepID=A0A437AMQ3_9MICR|nr:hypothetical protein TUBRATIS_10510 [Tubulinosema ratisbonensis]